MRRARWFLAWFMTPTNRRVFLAPGGTYTYKQDAALTFSNRTAALTALKAVPSRLRSPDFGDFVTVVTAKESKPP